MLLNRQPAGVKTPVNNPAEPVLLGFGNVRQNANQFIECIPGGQYREQCQNGFIWNRQQETAVSEFNAVCLCLPIV